MSSQRRRSRRGLNLSRECSELLDHLIDYLGDQVGLRSIEHLKGITLPARAIDWLSRNINNVATEGSYGADYDKWMLLKALFPHARKIRVTPDPWPKKQKSSSMNNATEQLRPANVDLTLFPGLHILWLDRVPVDWLSNVHTVRHSLTVLRITQSCIFDLRSTPLILQQNDAFTSLTHIKLSHCCIGEQSGLRPTRSGDPAPLATLSQSLRSISLANNELETEATALAGLSDLPDLVSLDLSYNRITTLPRIHMWLSNLETLNLSHNCVESVAGIDRITTLRTLRLDNNSLTDIEHTANCLAGLHGLCELHLEGNVDFGSDYRISVLNSFRERRFSTLDANYVERLTLRAVRSLLPILDDQPPTVDELRSLRSRSFVRIAVNAAARQGRRHRRRRRAMIANNDDHPRVRTTCPSSRLKKAMSRKILFTAEDVVASMTNPVDGIPESLLRSNHSIGAPVLVERPLEMSDHDLSIWEQLKENIGDTYRGSIHKQVIWPGEEKEGEKSQLSSTVLFSIKDGEELSQVGEGSLARSDLETTISVNEELTVASANLKTEENELKRSGTTTVTTADTTHLDQFVDSSTSVSSTPGGIGRSPTRSILSSPSSSQNQIRLSLQISSDNLWQDDSASVPSSLGTGFREGSPMSRREAFLAAEQHSQYEGTHIHRRLVVRKHLELYFRLFVFTPLQATPDIEEDWHDVLRNYPKIQLWPVDRKGREVAFQNSKSFSLRAEDDNESFRYIWKEKIVACGKNALRRLTPHRKTRYGFHGEQLWSAEDSATMRPDVTIEARNVICCCSDRCFYIITDHDTVTSTYNGKKPFPLAIPKKAAFKDAKWPHAMACHQLDSLEQVTIGFGFQRLTLHFSCASTSGGFTYILLTSSKADTISLFKKFQELSSNAREMIIGSPGPQSALCVENDDPHVLDAIATAIAPDTLGVVLRYQLLMQRWKHGERGSVRRVCVLTDMKLYLLDEDYVGDGSSNNFEGSLGRSENRLVDAAELGQITEVQAADADPKEITIVIAVSAFTRAHNWRLVCRTGESAEKLVDDVRKAIDQFNES